MEENKVYGLKIKKKRLRDFGYFREYYTNIYTETLDISGSMYTNIYKLWIQTYLDISGSMYTNIYTETHTHPYKENILENLK